MGFFNKKLLFVIFILMVLIGIVVTVILVRQQQDVRQRAAGGEASLTFAPKGGKTVYKEGEAFSVDVTIDPTVAIQGFDVTVRYDNQVLELESLKETESFEDDLLSHVDEASGTIRIAKGTKTSTGIGSATEIAKLNFKAISPGQGLISTHVEPEVVNTDAEAMTIDISPSTITVEENATPIPTSTATPIPTNTPTPTNTPIPTATFTPSPTPIPPTPTFTPTATPIPPTPTFTPTPTPDPCRVSTNKPNNCSCSGSSQCQTGYCSSTTDRCETKPVCNTGITCSTTCTAQANTCGTTNGTRTCTFTQNTTSGTNCTQVSAPSQTCGVNNCSTGRVCANSICVIPTPTPTNTPSPTPIPPTATFTPTPTRIPPTPTFTPTATPLPPTATFTPTATLIPTATNIPTATTDPCPLKPKGDANCDNKVNPQDFVLWKGEYLKQVTNRNADFNRDNVVNPQDFVIWKAGYLDTAVPH